MCGCGSRSRPRSATKRWRRAWRTGRPVEREFPLPVVEADGVVMTVPDAVTGPDQPVRVRLYSVGRERTLIVAAYTRGRLADSARVTVPAAAANAAPTEVRLLAG